MKRLLLIFGLALAAAAWAQSDAPEDEEGEATEVAEEAAEEEVDDSDLDRQGFDDVDDDFRPSEEIPADESIAFPTDI